MEVNFLQIPFLVNKNLQYLGTVCLKGIIYNMPM